MEKHDIVDYDSVCTGVDQKQNTDGVYNETEISCGRLSQLIGEDLISPQLVMKVDVRECAPELCLSCILDIIILT